PVVVKVAVLGRENGIDHYRRNVAQVYEDAVFAGIEGGQSFAVGVVDERRLLERCRHRREPHPGEQVGRAGDGGEEEQPDQKQSPTAPPEPVASPPTGTSVRSCAGRAGHGRGSRRPQGSASRPRNPRRLRYYELSSVGPPAAERECPS